MTYKNRRIASRLLSPHAGRGTVRGLGHFAPRRDWAHLYRAFGLRDEFADSEFEDATDQM